MKTPICCFFLLLIVFKLSAQVSADSNDPNMAVFNMDSLLQKVNATKSPWLPFFTGQNLLSGVYQLPVGGTDRQKPHETDEIYYVISGKGKFKAEGEEINVSKGTILYVKAMVAHQFFDITESLQVLVIFDRK